MICVKEPVRQWLLWRVPLLLAGSLAVGWRPARAIWYSACFKCSKSRLSQRRPRLSVETALCPFDGHGVEF